MRLITAEEYRYLQLKVEQRTVRKLHLDPILLRFWPSRPNVLRITLQNEQTFHLHLSISSFLSRKITERREYCKLYKSPHSLSHMHIRTLCPILKSHHEGKAKDKSTLFRTHQKWRIRSLVFLICPQYCIIPLLFTLLSRSGILYFIGHCQTSFVSVGRHVTAGRRRTRTPVLYDSKRKVMTRSFSETRQTSASVFSLLDDSHHSRRCLTVLARSSLIWRKANTRLTSFQSSKTISTMKASD